MRDHETGAPAQEPCHCALYEHLGTSVNGAGGLVQDEYLRVGQERACDGEQLTFTLRKVVESSSSRCRILGSVAHEVVDMRGFGRLRMSSSLTPSLP